MYPEYLKGCMDHAAQERMATTGKDMQKQSIQITDAWREELSAIADALCAKIARLRAAQRLSRGDRLKRINPALKDSVRRLLRAAGQKVPVRDGLHEERRLGRRRGPRRRATARRGR